MDYIFHHETSSEHRVDSGKLCLSAGLEREFTMFWTNHRAYSDHMYYLWHYGYVLLCNILLFPQPAGQSSKI